MGEKGDAAKAMSRNLHAAIERVREDVEKVEFWAEAVSGFSQPVPDYDPGKVNVWLPSEQANALKSEANRKAEAHAKSAARGKPTDKPQR